MKCPNCKYEYEGYWDINDGHVIHKGNKNFISIYTDQKLEIDNPKPYCYGDYNYENRIEVKLIACPKCKIVILCDKD